MDVVFHAVLLPPLDLTNHSIMLHFKHDHERCFCFVEIQTGEMHYIYAITLLRALQHLPERNYERFKLIGIE